MNLYLSDIKLYNDMCNNIFWNVKPSRANIDGDIHSRVFNLIRNFDCSSGQTIHPSHMFAMYYPLSHLNLYQPEYSLKKNCARLYVFVYRKYYTTK